MSNVMLRKSGLCHRRAVCGNAGVAEVDMADLGSAEGV